MIQKSLSNGVCAATISGPKKSITKKTLFLGLFSQETCDWLGDQLGFKLHQDQPRAKAFTGDDIGVIAGTYLLSIVKPESTWKTFLKNKERLGASKKKMERFIKYLTYNPKIFFEIINQDLKKFIKTNGKSTLDETMWAWLREDIASIEIEHKPESIGFKVLTMCFKLSRTNW